MQRAPDPDDPPSPPEPDDTPGPTPPKPDGTLATVEVVELTGESAESFQHALREALRDTGRPLELLRGVWIDDEEVVRDDEGRYPRFRLRLRAAFTPE